MNNTIRTIMVWLVIGVILTMVFMQVGSRQSSANILDYSTFMEEARQGRIAGLRRRGESGFHQGGQSGKQQSRILQETRSLCPYAEPGLKLGNRIQIGLYCQNVRQTPIRP